MATKRPACLQISGIEPKRRRHMLSIKEKVELLDMLKEGRTCAYVGRHYRINESTVRSIKKEEKNIRSTAAVTFHPTAKRVVTSRNRTIVKMESALSVWINDCRKKNIALDSVVIRTKAKQLYDRLAAKRCVQNGDEEEEAGAGPSSAATPGPTPFSASKGWFDKFQKRFGLKSVCLHGEAASASAGAEEYVNTFTDVMEGVGYSPEQVFNMDGASLFWRRVPSHTFTKEEAKDRLTVILCGNAAGFMIKPGLVYKSKNPPALKNVNKSSLPVHWMYNSKAWLTKVLTTSWFHDCFVPEVKLYLSEKGMEFKVVLLLTDNAGGHARDLEYEGVQVEFLPPNTTMHIQPMDQGIIPAFKALYTRNTLQSVVEAMDTDENFSLQAYWRNYTVASCLQNIQKSINEIKSETLNACWKKLWPEVVHDHKGLSPDEIHHSEVDKVVKLAKTVGGEGFMDMTAEDVNDLINVHAQLLTDEDLEELIQSSSEEEEEQDELVEEEAEKDEQLVEEAKQDKQLVEEEVEEEVGLTLDHLVTAARMAKELQQMIEEWDPNVVRSLHFSNAIDSAMSPYNIILAQKQNQQRQEELPITKFFTRRKRSVRQTSAAEVKVKEEPEHVVPLEEL